jgi:hypothetical protein
MFAAGLGWRDGSPAAPSYDQGTPEDAVATIELLLSKGLDINGTNSTGDTPLHAAVSGRAAPEIVRALVQHGAKLGRGEQARPDPAGPGGVGQGNQGLECHRRNPENPRVTSLMPARLIPGPAPEALGPDS